MQQRFVFSVDKDPDFWAKVKVGERTECWPWTGAAKPSGYGNVTRARKTESAHRSAWRLSFGEFPRFLHVLHACDNPSCCNPWHLMLGTNMANGVDMTKKGRSRSNHANRLSGERHHEARLTTDEVGEIRARYARGGVRQVDLAKEYGVSQRTISLITRNEVRTHG